MDKSNKVSEELKEFIASENYIKWWINKHPHEEVPQSLWNELENKREDWDNEYAVESY